MVSYCRSLKFHIISFLKSLTKYFFGYLWQQNKLCNNQLTDYQVSQFSWVTSSDRHHSVHTGFYQLSIHGTHLSYHIICIKQTRSWVRWGQCKWSSVTLKWSNRLIEPFYFCLNVDIFVYIHFFFQWFNTYQCVYLNTTDNSAYSNL